ncbi:hypothetical protein Lal_00016402 [Lupinus albus]|nr:hypothetical protein Lal_00016402 [Lupinus albus]
MENDKEVGPDNIHIEAWEVLFNEIKRSKRIRAHESYYEAMREDNERRLKQETNISANKFDFMSGRPIMEAILATTLMERYQMNEKDLYMVFIDVENAYDKVPK